MLLRRPDQELAEPTLGYAMSLEQIGAVTGQSPKAVSAMIEQALKKIRRNKRDLARFRGMVQTSRRLADRREYL